MLRTSAVATVAAVTVLEVIQRSADFLTQKGVESPRLQAELLLGHALKTPRLKLYLTFQRELAEAELGAMRELVKRRAAREPLQHIVGSTSFCGAEIQCTPDALIPRPETEILAERTWKALEAAGPGASMLDVGTGTGCIAIVAALHAPAAKIVAVDVSPQALELARRNAESNKVGDRIEFRLKDAFAEADGGGERFSIVASNPPYIPGHEIASLDPEVRDFDPRLALDGGTDGLDCYRSLAQNAGKWIAEGGRLMVEFGDGQAEALKTLFENEMWIVEEIVSDYSPRPRILIARPSGGR